jgi:hypothetical protein
MSCCWRLLKESLLLTGVIAVSGVIAVASIVAFLGVTAIAGVSVVAGITAIASVTDSLWLLASLLLPDISAVDGARDLCVVFAAFGVPGILLLLVFLTLKWIISLLLLVLLSDDPFSKALLLIMRPCD